MQHWDGRLGHESNVSRIQPAVGPLSRRAGTWLCLNVASIMTGIVFILSLHTDAGRFPLRILSSTCRSWRLLWASAVDFGSGNCPRLLCDPLLY